ncbi:unnamed protein product [Rotaria sp. Silwood2]|nr:unnamed protein product [Rotaria sp. Silwood2]CAF2837223.1 unnamed protein product [Rotaria sp. Silwood2]CAF3199958.1 unnamed protein product [Rotaria sp. Silwood2]CAF3280672.1 unnamed protein product [Rotaria sp. Silwood2]
MMNQSKRERRQNRDQEGRKNFIELGTSNDYWSWWAQESAVHYLNPNQSAPQQPCSTNFRYYGTSNQPQQPRSASYRQQNSTRTGVHTEQRPHSDQNRVRQNPRPTKGEKIPNDPNQRNECRLPQQKTQNNVSVIASQQTSNAHLIVLKSIFDKIIIKQFLSKTSIEEGLRIYNQLRDIIVSKKPDAQVTLYGSFYFACCSNDSPMMDVDVTVNTLLPYNTITQVFEIIRNSDTYQEMRLNTDYDPLCIDLIVPKTNIRIRVTSDNKRRIFSSEIVRLYTRFDPRVLPLLRLIRFFAKICSLDRPDLGTLHPMVFHLMLIHFLQQIEEPVLPCLHEYVFGIDNALVTLSDDQYSYTIKLNSSFRYFRRVFEQTLTYFCQKDPRELEQQNSIIKEVHRSCKSLFATVLLKVPRKANCTQDDLRQAYKHTFDNRMEALPEPKLVPNEKNLLSIMDETAEDTDDLEETYQDDLDTDCEINNETGTNFSESFDNTINDHEIEMQEQDTTVVKTASSNELEAEGILIIGKSQSSDKETNEQPISFELLVENLNEEQKHIVRLEYQRQEQGKSTKESIKTRENIINYLEIEFRKMYPNCRMRGYGSFYNGFNFHQSDLDVCILLELNVCIFACDNFYQ